MKISLYKYIEAEDKLIEGNFLGTVGFENGNLFYDLPDPVMKEKITSIFSKSFEYYEGKTFGGNSMTMLKMAKPGTEEFFKKIIYELPKYNIKAVFEGS